MNGDGWRVMVDRNMGSFARDELNIYIAHRDHNGIRLLKPVEFELSEYLPEDAGYEYPYGPTAIKTELAEILATQLTYHLLGIEDPVKEIQRLRAELGQANRRIEKLIDGIGRLGGNNS